MSLDIVVILFIGAVVLGVDFVVHTDFKRWQEKIRKKMEANGEGGT